MSGHVTLYSATGCPHSARARDVLATTGRSFTEIDVRLHPERVPELLKLTRGRRVVPVLVDDAGVQVAPHGGTAF